MILIKAVACFFFLSFFFSSGECFFLNMYAVSPFSNLFFSRTFKVTKAAVCFQLGCNA